MIRRRAVVVGVVQGVGFRWSARAMARRLGVVGWVRNLADGGVEAEVEGDPVAVEAMLDWLRRGPPGASVARVTVEEIPVTGGADFEITR